MARLSPQHGSLKSRLVRLAGSIRLGWKPVCDRPSSPGPARTQHLETRKSGKDCGVDTAGLSVAVAMGQILFDGGDDRIILVNQAIPQPGRGSQRVG